MSDSVTALPLPQRCNSVEQALGAAKNAGLSHCLILSETEDGFLILNAGESEPLTLAECVFLLRKAEHVLFGQWERASK